MTVEASIFAALQGLVGSRCYPDVAPELTARPFITYQQVGGESINFVELTIPAKSRSRFQINVWADTRPSAAAVAKQVEDALRVLIALQPEVMGQPVALYETGTKLRGSMQDFSFLT